MSDNIGNGKTGKDRQMLGIISIFIGGWGVHRFMLGDTKGGILRIVISVCTCGIGGIIGLIEGITYLTKTDEEFEEIYIRGGKEWF